MSKKIKSIVSIGAAAAVIAGFVATLKKTSRGQKISSEAKKHFDAMRTQIFKEAKKMKVSTQKEYNALVDDVVTTYTKQKKITKKMLGDLSTTLKDHWEETKEEIAKTTKK